MLIFCLPPEGQHKLQIGADTRGTQPHLLRGGLSGLWTSEVWGRFFTSMVVNEFSLDNTTLLMAGFEKNRTAQKTEGLSRPKLAVLL